MRAFSVISRLDASQRTRRVSSAAMIVARASSAASRGEASSAWPIGTAASVSTPPSSLSRSLSRSSLRSLSRSAMAAFSTTVVRLAGPGRHK
jgi:hypothetical protein